MSEPIELETDREVAECIEPAFGSRGLRVLASNLGVSRERGDTKMETAERIVEQEPAVAAAIVENDWEVDMDATAFKERRGVWDETIDLGEAIKRAKYERMKNRLTDLRDILRGLPSYEAEVSWDLGSGLTSIIIEGDDVGVLARSRAHVILTAHGAARTLQVSAIAYDQDYAEDYSGNKAWRMFKPALERFHDPRA